MQADAREEGRRWLGEARADLHAVQVLIEARHWNLACFHCQQAAEKAVKAFLYSRGLDQIWGHSVSELLHEASRHRKSLAKLVRLGGSLDKFYIPTRYPDGLPGGLPSEAYTREDALAAMKTAARVLEGIQRLVK